MENTTFLQMTKTNGFKKNFPEGAGSYFIITKSFLVREESVFIIVRFVEESWEISKKIKFQGL